MNTKDFLDKVERAWNDWQARISCFPPEKMLEAGIYDEWSLKDVITHLTWYEQEMVRMLEMRELAGSELWEIPLDERNELIRRQLAEKTLQEILDEANRVHERLMALLPALADTDLQEPACIAGMPPDWKPWEVLASNTFEHYEEHLANLDDLKDQP
jgi:hypothetical protein